MNIAFDASILRSPEFTGVEKSFISMLRGLSLHPTGHRFFLVSPENCPRIEGLSTEFSNVSLATRAGPLWRERAFAPWLAEQHIDIVHSPVTAFPLLAAAAKICTVHELPWTEQGTRGDEGRAASHRAWAQLAAMHATRIVCVSRTTAQRLREFAASSAERIRVIYHGIEPRFVPCAEKQIDPPYFLCLGRTRRKKNALAALRAFRVFLDRSAAPHRLLFAGPAGEDREAILEKAQALGLQERVRLLGYVAERELPALYSGAQALLYLSFSEGFGLPPIEAMACGTPVIAAARGAIPEIAGEGALLVDPEQPLATAEAVEQIVLDPAFRAARVEAGKYLAAKYSLEANRKAVLSLYAEFEESP